AKKLEQIDELVRSIGEVGLGKSGSYDLPAMLANVAYMTGASVHYNCKSGKDRTGIMDAETKYMARELALGRQGDDKELPGLSPGDRSEEEEHRHQQMLWEGGNLDVLRQNVGGQCLKTADLKMLRGGTDYKLMRNLGGKKKLGLLSGLKRYANIDTIAKVGR